MNDEVFIVGVGMTPLGKFPQLSVKELTRMAVATALRDAGLSLAQIDAAWFSNSRQGQMEGQNSIRGQCALRSMGFESIPIVNVENACCSSSTGLNQACASIRAGIADFALVVGAEKMFYPQQKEQMLQAFRGGWDVHTEAETTQRLLSLGVGVEIPPAADGDTGARSVFMDIYAAVARQHMGLYGTTQRQIASVAAKNHHHSTLNPLAQYQQDMSIDEVLADRLVSWPLTRSMCAPLSDGAAAIVLCSGRRLGQLDKGRAVRILASALASGSNRDPHDLSRHIGRVAADKAYAQAGIGPQDIDVAEVHDATSFAEILHVENLRFCAPGEGGAMAERGDTRLGGRLPVNPSGGLVSKGHPIGATGAIQIHELVTQLRGEAGRRQVPGARFAAAENGGGFYGTEEAATVVTLLARP
ncbi:thiolase family protein [Aquincola sp. S2]|uniref:propanoyl-CoA C-acyltransferase n=1 Tax=Pseudaquabacterium terrae TaxID=2732868 RepID=A0ABX2EUP9_9BURK|nr:thiolase family protein [Aquabacterium terrae]NRF72372.1 thiolase family protein [Aquabacterium terrae]